MSSIANDSHRQQRQQREQFLGLVDSSQALFPELFTTVVQQSLWESEEDDDNDNEEEEEEPILECENDIEMQHAVSVKEFTKVENEDQHCVFDQIYAPQVHQTFSAGSGEKYADVSSFEALKENDVSLQRFPRLKRLLKRSDQRFGHLVNLETSVADSEDFPRRW
jgi:hypothetical protein